MGWRWTLWMAETGRTPALGVGLFAALVAADSGTMVHVREAPSGTPNCQVEDGGRSLPIGTGKAVSPDKAQQDADAQGKAPTGFLDLRRGLTACFARDAYRRRQPQTAGRQREQTIRAGLRSPARIRRGSQLLVTAEPK
jgi:hypothetical protein